MKVYGYLRSMDQAIQIFDDYHAPDLQQSEAWAGVYLHWEHGYILVVSDHCPEVAPYPYEDAVLHCERCHGAWHIRV